MGRRIIGNRIGLLILFLCCINLSAIAQNDSFAKRLGCSTELMAEGFGDSHSFMSLEIKAIYKISPCFSLFVPVAYSELLYNKKTEKNYDNAARCGVGLRVGHRFASKDEIAASVSGLSTIGKADSNYGQIRIMGEYIMTSALIYGIKIGVGAEYLASYKSSSFYDGFYPVVSIGIML